MNEEVIGGVKSHLTIKDLVSDDFADYNCTIRNERGMDSVIITLSLVGQYHLCLYL